MAAYQNRKLYFQQYYLANKEKINKYTAANQEKIKKYKKEHYQKNKEKYSTQRKKRYVEQRNKILAENAEYRKKNRVKVNKYFTDRVKKDLNFRLATNLRKRLLIAIKRGYKAGSAIKTLGCSIDELKTHLEKQFKPSMTWQNYGRSGWHIDHIKPLSRFDLGNPEDLKIACHYTNLQPLWYYDNISKGNKHE
jgi:hypothetical protein